MLDKALRQRNREAHELGWEAVSVNSKCTPRTIGEPGPRAMGQGLNSAFTSECSVESMMAQVFYKVLLEERPVLGGFQNSPQTSNISISCEPDRSANSWALLRPSESESQGVLPSNLCF